MPSPIDHASSCQKNLRVLFGSTKFLKVPEGLKTCNPHTVKRTKSIKNNKNNKNNKNIIKTQHS